MLMLYHLRSRLDQSIYSLCNHFLLRQILALSGFGRVFFYKNCMLRL